MIPPAWKPEVSPPAAPEKNDALFEVSANILPSSYPSLAFVFLYHTSREEK